MRQRLKLAQALVHDPDLLFLDEPTNGMDPQGRQAMLSLITDLGRAGISVLLSSHLLPDVERVCERAIIMGGGQILASGRIDEMRKRYPTLYTIDYAGDGATFRRALEERQVTVLEHSDSSIAVELPAADRQNDVLQVARETGVKIRGLHPKRSSLEETFMDAIRRQGAR
jgi:ABC-2 type transport system ATP-binding protein